MTRPAKLSDPGEKLDPGQLAALEQLVAQAAKCQTQQNSVDGVAVAQSSKVSGRVHRLLNVTARHESPTLISRMALSTGSGFIATLTALLISCRTPAPALPKPVTAPAVISVSGKDRPGKARIQFTLIEITETKDALNPYLELAQTTSTAAPASYSLKDLSQRRGVDLLSLPAVGEGQQVEYSGGPYRLTLSGEKSAPGDTVLTKASITVDGKPAPLSFESLRIPNGGFVVLSGTYQPASPKDKSSRRRVLALSASSNPLPGKSPGDTEKFPLPGDASFPSGAKLISYDVTLIEKEKGQKLPGGQALPERCTAEQAAKILALMRKMSGVSITSYPKATVIAGQEVNIRRLMVKSFERPRQPSEPAMDKQGHPSRYVNSVEVGTRLKLTGRPSRDRLKLEVSFQEKKITGEVKFPGGWRVPLVGAASLSSHIDLDDNSTCCFFGGIDPPRSKPETELVIFIATSQSHPQRIRAAPHHP